MGGALVVVDDGTERLAASARLRRAELLKETDWSQGKDVPEATSARYVEYRQKLRDISLQEGFPRSIEWPASPDAPADADPTVALV